MTDRCKGEERKVQKARDTGGKTMSLGGNRPRVKEHFLTTLRIFYGAQEDIIIDESGV